MKMTKQDAVAWAKEELSKQDNYRGEFRGETQNGFYFFFWKVPDNTTTSGGIMIRNRLPAPGTPSIFVSKNGFIIKYGRVSPLMFDHYLTEGLITPEPTLDEQGEQTYYMGLPRYQVNHDEMLDELNSIAVSGTSCYKKYGSFPNPEEL